MKKIFTEKIPFIIMVLGFMLSFQVHSQTVVQWYTSMGDFRAQLREDLVPMTAQNFIDLTNDNFYDDLIFHRVIEGFMIQDGCPDGTGYGGPGYTFDDEFHPDLRHDQPGILSMANAGPNTNGSQYFITVVPTSWLDDAHAVFGKIIDGMEVVYAISEVETNSNDKPVIDVVIDSIRVVTGDPMIELTAPISGGKWNGMLDNEITWNSAFIADVKIEFSSDNAQSWEVLTDAHSAHYRSYTWELPSVVSDECFIKISDVANPGVYSMNDEAFTLCSLDLLSPNGFEVFMVDLPMNISWNSEFVDDLSIFYQAEEGGDWTLIEEGVSADAASYEWVPEIPTGWCKIKVLETEYPDVADESEFRFFVYQLDLLSPQGGEDLEGLSEFNIEWEGEVIPNVKIEFSSDDGDSWEVIDANASVDESPYAWTVPNISSEDCFIKLSVPSAPELFKTNPTNFAIHEAVGLNELNNHGMKVSVDPNPVKDFVNIHVQKKHGENEEITLDIYNSKGQLVLKQDIGIHGLDKEQIMIDTQELPQGIYFININISNKTQSIKFIKM